jgi:hypothetical protein
MSNKITWFLVSAFAFLSSHLWSATVVSSSPINLMGVNYDYYFIRFVSSTGENNVSADVLNNSLKVDFTGFGSQSSGTGSNAAMDFSTGNLGLTMSSKSPSTIAKLDITADGTFSLAAPFNSAGYAGFNVAVPFNLTLTGVNGTPFLTSAPTVGLSLGVTYSPPGSATYVDSPAPELSSGNWKANWNGDVAALFPTVFTSPTMKVTEISLAITPNVTVWSQNGSASAYLTDIILQPIPEPSALSLLGFGGLALFFARRFRR